VEITILSDTTLPCFIFTDLAWPRT